MLDWAKFESKCMPIPESGCVIWMGGVSSAGYGLVWDKQTKTMNYVHRLVYQFHNGEIPDGFSICHKCDVTSCVNPDHLFLGTHAANMRDMATKGRASRINKAKGSKQGSSKLTEEDVINISEMLSTNKTLKEIGKEFRVSAQTIFRIKHKKQHGGWAHIAR